MKRIQISESYQRFLSLTFDSLWLKILNELTPSMLLFDESVWLTVNELTPSMSLFKRRSTPSMLLFGP